MSQSVAVVAKLYQSVIDDVISNARESFLDEGVDEQVLQELKQIWEAKLLQSKAVEPPDAPDILQSGADGNRQISNGQQTVVGQTTTNITTAHFPPNQLVPVQINIPIQQGNTNGPQKSITVQVPASALQGGATQLQTVLSSPAVAAALALPPETAAAMLQQHINAAIQSGQLMAGHINFLPRIRLPDYRNYIRRPVIRPNPLSGRMMAHNLQCPSGQFAPVPKQVLPHSGLGQLDGPADTSDEDEEDDDDEDDEDEDRENEDKDQEENDYEGQDEEPLNSEDDVSDEDLSDLFDTDNVVVAQYDKITRSRNKWKFHLKDGIMNLQGRDYVFQKAGGDAEW